MAKKMMPTISMMDYKPDNKAMNRALFGKDEAPTDKDQEEFRKELDKKFEELRNLGKR